MPKGWGWQRGESDSAFQRRWGGCIHSFPTRNTTHGPQRQKPLIMVSPGLVSVQVTC